MKTAELKVESREIGKKSSVGQLRRDGRVPANVYGGGSNANCSFDARDLKRATGGHVTANLILTLKSDSKELDGKRAIIKAVERDPVNWRVVHCDLYEIRADQALTVEIPLSFVGIPKGVKLGGGILQIVRREVEIKALPDDIPSSIEVDISDVDIDENLHVSDLKVSDKVQIMDDGAFTVMSVSEAKEEKEPAAAAEAAGAEGDGAVAAAGTTAAADGEKAKA